jgi:hypothetical protein
VTEQDILDRIDDAIRPVCGWCTRALPENGPSLDFCDDEHQELWTTRRGEPIVGYREAGLGYMDMEGEDSPLAEAARRVNGRSWGLYQVWSQSTAQPRSSITWVDETQGWTAGRIADLFEVPREFVGGQTSEAAIPVSPAQAALEARRNRNTGPASRSRAPKNIGWGRGRP